MVRDAAAERNDEPSRRSGGAAVVRGKHVGVEQILFRLAAGRSEKQTAGELEINVEDVRAALTYAARLVSGAEHAERHLEAAIQMLPTATQLTEQRLRREHPDASDTEIRQMVTEWLHAGEGACEGFRPVSAERLRRILGA